MKRGIWWACLLLCGSAHAQEGVRWQYIAPPECPNEQQFRELVQARLLGDPGATDSAKNKGAESAVGVEVRLEPAQHRATLLLKEPNAAPVERVVAGDSCEELVSGLALITALAFGAAREPPNEAGTAMPRAAEPVESTKAVTPAPALEQVPPAAPVPPSPREPAHRDPSSAAALSRPLGVELGAGGWVNSWSAPNAGFGGDLFVRLAPKGASSWSVRASGLYGFRSVYVGDRLADFRFLGGRAEGCPISRSYFQQVLSAEACLGLELGALRGRGRDSSALLEGASDTVFSATALVTGRLRAHIGRRFFVEGQGDLGLPLVHHDFVFEDPPERIFQIPVLGFAARLGLGVRFP